MSRRPTTLIDGGTLNWVIRLYDANGVLVDADATPTVVFRRNGASTADTATVTKRAATTGIYDCDMTPTADAEGDQFTVEETATISAQDYENSWAFEIFAPERGTDSANTTAPDNAGIAANGTAIAALNDFNPATDTVANVTLVATCTSNTDMRGTDSANTVAPDNAGIASLGVSMATVPKLNTQYTHTAQSGDTIQVTIS